MSGQTPRDKRGFLLHEPLISLDNLEANTDEATTSDYSQTGSRPGLPARDDDLGTYLPHVHTGQGADLDIIALSAGIPRPDTGAGIGYRETGEADTLVRGWHEPNTVMGYRPVDWTTTSTWLNTAIVTCPISQKVIVVAYDNDTAVDVSFWVWDPATRDWTARADLAINEAVGPKVAMWVQKRTNRVIAASGTSGFDTLWYSDDDGSTWAKFGQIYTGIPDDTATKWRAVEDANGNVLVLAVDEATGEYWQLVSTDGGLSFEEVDTDTGFGTHASLSLTPSGRIVVVYRNGTSDASWVVLTDAFDPISGKTPQLIDGTTNTVTIESCIDADGVIYTYHSLTSSDIVKVFRSLDEGATFALYSGELLATGGSIADPTTHQHRVRGMTASGGEIVALFNSVHSGTSPSTDGSLLSLIGGGWSNVEVESGGVRRAQRFGWAAESSQDIWGIFLPTETLENQGWTHVGAANALVNGYHRYNASGAAITDTVTFAGHTDDELLFCELRVISGGSAASDALFFRHVRRTGAARRSVTLRLTTTSFLVRDDEASSTLATVTHDMTTTTQFLISTRSAVLSVWYRHRADTLWQLAVQTTITSTVVVTAATDQVAVGTGAVTADLRVGLIGWGAQTNPPGYGLTNNGLFTEALFFGHSNTSLPYPLRDQLDEDSRMARLSGNGGVARLQETWSIPASWDYGIREIHPIESPSPAQKWRSQDLTEQTLTWDLGADSRLGHCWAMGVALVGANFRRAIVEVSTSAAPSTFVELGTYNSRVVSGGTFTRQGNLILPGSATPLGSLFFGSGWLKRGFVTLDPGGTPVNRRILWNEGGGWMGSGMRTVLRLEEVDGTEPTSGDIHVQMDRGVLVIHRSAPTAFRRIRLRIPNQDCVDDYFELGKVVMGALVIGGRQWGRGFSFRDVPLTRNEEDDRGTVYVEPRGDPTDVYRRELTLSWQDGYSTAAIRQQTPRFLAAGDGTPLVADQDVWFQMAGFLRLSRGGAIPCCPLTWIPDSTQMVLDPTLWGYGRLGVGQSWQINHVQGKEGRSELYRGESLTWVELK